MDVAAFKMMSAKAAPIGAAGPAEPPMPFAPKAKTGKAKMASREEATEPAVNRFAKKGKMAKGKTKGKAGKGKMPPWVK